ncbi:hypothetical protein DID75_00920 [Candidatus Marinamargulisbacteria bacterium SCGC AG-410-N11]|nr:hypothetical protein DID75_00920 [Candidatus Marinamargulisbacteria bacterium SCGC AG-410-N11]
MLKIISIRKSREPKVYCMIACEEFPKSEMVYLSNHLYPDHVLHLQSFKEYIIEEKNKVNDLSIQKEIRSPFISDVILYDPKKGKPDDFTHSRLKDILGINLSKVEDESRVLCNQKYIRNIVGFKQIIRDKKLFTDIDGNLIIEKYLNQLLEHMNSFQPKTIAELFEMVDLYVMELNVVLKESKLNIKQTSQESLSLKRVLNLFVESDRYFQHVSHNEIILNLLGKRAGLAYHIQYECRAPEHFIEIDSINEKIKDLPYDMESPSYKNNQTFLQFIICSSESKLDDKLELVRAAHDDSWTEVEKRQSFTNAKLSIRKVFKDLIKTVLIGELNIFHQDKNGNTCLHNALLVKNDNFYFHEIIRMKNSRPKLIETVNNKNKTPLHIFIEQFNEVYNEEKLVFMINSLASSNNINIITEENKTSLDIIEDRIIDYESQVWQECDNVSMSSDDSGDESEDDEIDNSSNYNLIQSFQMIKSLLLSLNAKRATQLNAETLKKRSMDKEISKSSDKTPKKKSKLSLKNCLDL